MTDATARTILERLLTEGRNLARQAEDTAAQRLNVGDDPASRQKLRQTGLAGGAALGVAAMLLGSRRRNSFSPIASGLKRFIKCPLLTLSRRDRSGRLDLLQLADIILHRGDAHFVRDHQALEMLAAVHQSL